ncbi:MAG: winged helix-turn-helix transcriptional regulator [Solirubrobacterales bacterium]|nr:winged helix-turn-helix transcriptional regulator [Solirubrobacterales bacterium]
MIESMPTLDLVFGSLSDPVRRDIVRRVAGKELSVSEVAEPYSMSLAAVSKHLKVLERAKLVVKRRQGKQLMVGLAPDAFTDASDFLDFYKTFAVENMNSLEHFLKKEQDDALN